MSFKEVTKDGQPRNVYDYPKDVSGLIYRGLGVFLGFLNFQHNFQALTDLLMLLKTIRTMEDEDIRMGYGLLVNEHTKKPIKVKLDRESLSRLEQVWERGGYIYTKYLQVNENFIDIQGVVYLFEYPNWKFDANMEEIQIMPSLFGLKSKDETTSESQLMRINEGVPERDAYRWHDPVWLCETCHLEYEKDGVIIPYFKTHQDIQRSPYYTQEVPRLYYDVMTSIAWRESLTWLTRLHVNLVAMAKDLEVIEFTSSNKQIVKTRRIEEA